MLVVMKSCAAISRFRSPEAASRAICASWGVRTFTGVERFRTCSPVAASSLRARDGERGRADRLEELERLVQRLASLFATPRPPQPLAVQQLRSRRVRRDRDCATARRAPTGSARRPRRQSQQAHARRARRPRAHGVDDAVARADRLSSACSAIAFSPASDGRLDEVGEGERTEDDAVVVSRRVAPPERGVVLAGAELEHGERRVGVVDADALSAVVRRARITRRARIASPPRCPATRPEHHVRGAGDPSSTRVPVSDTTSSISARWRRPIRSVPEAPRASFGSSARAAARISAPVRRASCTHASASSSHARSSRTSAAARRVSKNTTWTLRPASA